MFKCEKCGGITKRGEKIERVLVELRKVDYYIGAGDGFSFIHQPKKTGGTEIVKEAKFCKNCAKLAEKPSIVYLLKEVKQFKKPALRNEFHRHKRWNKRKFQKNEIPA